MYRSILIYFRMSKPEPISTPRIKNNKPAFLGFIHSIVKTTYESKRHEHIDAMHTIARATALATNPRHLTRERGKLTVFVDVSDSGGPELQFVLAHCQVSVSVSSLFLAFHVDHSIRRPGVIGKQLVPRSFLSATDASTYSAIHKYRPKNHHTNLIYGYTLKCSSSTRI